MTYKTTFYSILSIAITCISLHARSIETIAPPRSVEVGTKKEDWLILDGTKNFSYAMARLLLSQNKPCTLVVHPKDMFHIEQRFEKDNPLLTVIESDYSAAEGKQELIKAAEGKKFMYLDPECADYLKWHSTIVNITTNALVAARTHNLTVFYPGRIYPFGTAKTITNKSEHNPGTEQGKTLAKVEKMMQFMAEKKLCKIRIIRTSYPFGPGMYDFLLSTSFKEVPSNGRLTWLYRTDHPYQFCYTHDAARLTELLSSHDTQSYHKTVAFGGYTYNSVKEFGEAMCQTASTQYQTQQDLKQRVVGSFQLNIVSKFQPNALRGTDLAEFFQTPVMIDDASLYEELSFTPTPARQALADTLDWYKNNTDTKGLFIL